MSGRKGISYVQNDVPEFIKQFKQRVGYKEGPNVDTKKEIPNFDEEDDRPEQDDEKPVVVVLKSGDLTQEEADKAQVQADKQIQQEEDEKAIKDGKIVFKKPSKRSGDPPSDLNVSSAKKKKDSDKKKKSSQSGKVKNSKLLSFDEDEEEEEDT